MRRDDAGQRDQAAVLEGARKHHFVVEIFDLLEVETVQVHRGAYTEIAAQSTRKQHPRAGLLEAYQVNLQSGSMPCVSQGRENIMDAFGRQGPVVSVEVASIGEIGDFHVGSGPELLRRVTGAECVQSDERVALIDDRASRGDKFALLPQAGDAIRMHPA